MQNTVEFSKVDLQRLSISRPLAVTQLSFVEIAACESLQVCHIMPSNIFAVASPPQKASSSANNLSIDA